MSVRAVDLALVRALEERCFNAWPTLRTVLADGWILRLADGHTKRANSASALYPSTLGAVDLAALVAEQFRASGLVPVIRATPLAGPDFTTDLTTLGWQEDDPSLGLYAPRIDAGPVEADLLIEPKASDAWIDAAMQAYGHGEFGAKALRRTLDNLILPAAFVTLKTQGQAAAWGLAVYERGMVGLYDLVVAPEQRGAGLGRRLVHGLLAWGAGQGASAAYLQVREGNVAARKLYESLGFVTAYRYTHWVLAGGDECAANNCQAC